MKFWLSAYLVAMGVVLFSQGTPSLTPVETLQLENVRLKMEVAKANADVRACLGVLAPLAARADRDTLTEERRKVIAAIEVAHPGQTVDEHNALVPKE